MNANFMKTKKSRSGAPRPYVQKYCSKATRKARLATRRILAEEQSETTEEKNHRIIAQAIAQKKRLSIVDGLWLATGFQMKQASSKMWRETAERMKEDLEELKKDCSTRSDLAGRLAVVAKSATDRESCASSATVWNRCANLIDYFLRKHFPRDGATEAGIEKSAIGNLKS